MTLPTETFLRFDLRLREVLAHAEKDMGLRFPQLQSLIRSEGGFLAAKRLLSRRDHFSEGFKQLLETGNLKYSVEAVILEFRDTALFTPNEIATAEWRLLNADQSRSQ